MPRKAGTTIVCMQCSTGTRRSQRHLNQHCHHHSRCKQIPPGAGHTSRAQHTVPAPSNHVTLKDACPHANVAPYDQAMPATNTTPQKHDSKARLDGSHSHRQPVACGDLGLLNSNSGRGRPVVHATHHLPDNPSTPPSLRTSPSTDLPANTPRSTRSHLSQLRNTRRAPGLPPPLQETQAYQVFHLNRSIKTPSFTHHATLH